MKALRVSIGPCGRSSRDRSASKAIASIAICLATVAAALAPELAPAQAQKAAYPERPIALIVGYLSGSAPDIVARAVGPVLAEHLGQPVVIENKAGVAGTMALGLVARARNDGYTLGLVNPAIIGAAPAIYPNLPYDPLRDLAAVINLAITPSVVVVSGNSPAKSMQEFITMMKAKRGPALYASTGVGSNMHLQGALLARLGGFESVHVPYRAQSDQLIGVVSGEIDFTFSSVPGAIGFIKDGRLRALGVSTAERSPLLPDVPSLAELGLKGFDKTTLWFGLVVPSGTPEPVVDTLHRASVKALMDPRVRQSLTKVGFEPAAPAPAREFADFMRDQVPFWSELVRASGAGKQ